MSTITLSEVTKRYADGTEAVSNLNIDITDGELLILVGPSGCGKTTALRMVAGLETISSGELRIDGELVNDIAPRERDVAMVFQNYALYPHMTVQDNMGFPLKLAGGAKAERERLVTDAARVLDLESHLARRPANLSGGQRQRVAMGRAIVRQPKAFLMDEPLSNLDAKLRVQMRTEIARLQRRLGTTTLYVTHDQTEAMTLGDRVALMRGGVLQQIGHPGELYAEPVNLFVASLIGSPAMNLIAGTFEEGLVRTPLGDVPLTSGAQRALVSSELMRRGVVVGVRPEHLRELHSEQIALDEAVLRVEVEHVESTGADLFVRFATRTSSAVIDLEATGVAEAGEQSSDLVEAGIARFGADSTIRAGATTSFKARLQDIHLFDPSNGQALTRAAGPRGS